MVQCYDSGYLDIFIIPLATGVVSQPWTRLLRKLKDIFWGFFFFLMETEIQHCLFRRLPFHAMRFSLASTGIADG